MKNSFRTKIIVAFLIVIVLSMSMLTVLSNVLLKPVFVYNSRNTMIDYYSVIDSSLSSPISETRAILEELNKSYGITSQVVDPEGNVICSYTKIKSNGNTRERFLRLINLYENRDITDEYYFKSRKDEADNIKKIIYVCKASDGSYVIMNKAIKGIEQDTKIVCFFLLIMSITISTIGTVVWAIFTRKFTEIIKKMSETTRRMSELDFSEKINLNLGDEIGTLAASIDLLSDELEESINGLKDDIERQKRLIRDISHELKTPVTTVKGYIENIEAMSSDDQILRNYCRIASEECDEIDNLVEEMLEMSRLESQGYVCDMDYISTKKIETVIRDKLSLEFRESEILLDFESAEILCNSILVIRAVMNFVKNAVKHGEKTGIIEIKGYISDGFYVFSVSNPGKEISEDEKENIWDLFYKNDKSRHRNESHGIGLSIVRQIAKLHSGTVALVSEKGKNIFSFTVPIN